MAEQRMVPVELLEEIERDIRIHTDATCSYVGRSVLNDIRAIIDGPGVEPVATLVEPPLDSMKGDFWMTEEDAIRLSKLPYGTRLYRAAPSAPVQRLPEGCAWAVTKGGHSICQPPKSWDKQAPAQAVPDGWQLINRTPTPEQRELLLRADEFTVPEMWVMLLAAAPQPPKESTAQSVACPTKDA